MKLYPRALTAIVALAVSACDGALDIPEELSYEEKIVLNGLLIAGAPIDSIRVNLTSDITQPYDPVNSALSGATVTLGYEGNVDTLEERPGAAGIYRHPDPNILVKKNTKYTIEVDDGAHSIVTASTTVPGDLELVDIQGLADTLTYIPAGEDAQFLVPTLYTFRVGPANGDIYPPLIRIVNIALDAREETMIMEDDTLKAFIFKWDGLGHEEPEDIRLRVLTKRAISFNSVDFDQEYKMGWIFFTFYGPQMLAVFAMDSAYYNYHRGNLEGPPRDFNYLPESNVKGGYGLLSSAALSTGAQKFYYLRRP